MKLENSSLTIDYTLGLRVTMDEEMKGLDMSLHGESILGTGTLGGGGMEDEDFSPDSVVDTILYESKSQSLVGAPADAIAAVLMTSQEHKDSL